LGRNHFDGAPVEAFDTLTFAPYDAMYRIRRCIMASTALKLPSSPAETGLQTFADDGDRKRLSGTAIKAVVRLVEAWGGNNAEGAALFGVSASTWDRIKAGTWQGTLSQDQLTRASALIGVFKGLHLLFADTMADRWPRLPNRAPLFDRKSPVEAMIAGGIPHMIETRQYIDALRGGL
jgi:hypothetical protein